MNALNIVLLLLFEASLDIELLFKVLYIVGLIGVFTKSGLAWWWALVPCYRDFQLSRCAGRESEGHAYFLTAVMMVVLNFMSLFVLQGGSNVISGKVILISILAITVGIARLIYGLRIFLGLIEVYGVRKRWLLLCITGYISWLPLLIWGFSKKYQPGWKVEDIKAMLAKLAHQGSASVMDEGLTVNLKERTVIENFQKKVLLRDIHMAIPQGHMVLLLGGSGAGKTTFLNAVNGYEKANAEVMLNGTNMYTQYKKMQYEVGFVPQSEMMRGKNTVINTLMDAAKLRLPMDVSAADRKARVEEVMDIFGLTPVKNNLVEKLSGGQKKRLSISMEFISNPSLFILDEPDSGLDGVMARELFEQLRKIADTGKIVIVITHTPDRVIDLFDDVIVLAKDSARTGRLAYYGSIEDARKFFERERMEQIVKSVNRVEEGGDGLADEFVMKYAREVV